MPNYKYKKIIKKLSEKCDLKTSYKESGYKESSTNSTGKSNF